MERLLIGYAIVLLICVWLYPQANSTSDLAADLNSVFEKFDFSDDTDLTQYSLTEDANPELNDGQVKLAVEDVTKLPKSKYPRLQGAYTLTQLIKKDEPSTMTISENYESVSGEKIKILAEVEFPAGSLERDTEITMVIDNKTGDASFFPKVNFSKDAQFSMKILGENQRNIGEGSYPMGNTLQSVSVNLGNSKSDEGTLAANSSDLSDI